jgi:hypothetical protein
MNWTVIWTDIITYAPMVISAASAAAAVLPKAPAGSILATMQNIVDWLALNFGNAKKPAA